MKTLKTITKLYYYVLIFWYFQFLVNIYKNIKYKKNKFMLK
jgi:hypothetical protein